MLCKRGSCRIVKKGKTASINFTGESPSLAQKAAHAAAAGGRIVRAVVSGEPVLAPPEVREARLAICRACPGGFWREEGNAGFGECRHPQCGCTKLKQGLLTEHCPAGHWPATTA